MEVAQFPPLSAYVLPHKNHEATLDVKTKCLAAKAIVGIRSRRLEDHVAGRTGLFRPGDHTISSFDRASAKGDRDRRIRRKLHRLLFARTDARHPHFS